MNLYMAMKVLDALERKKMAEVKGDDKMSENKKGITPEIAEEIRIRRGLGRTSALKSARLKKGFSQQQLADKTGVSLSAIGQYEDKRNAIVNARYRTLKSLANVLDCTVEELMGEE